MTRAALLRAAADVVGEVGYRGASVAKITERAGVAQGTFYNYFESRQDLFDELLPRMGETMLAFIRDHVSEDAIGLQRERQRILAYFRFLRETPGFYRVLYEAETLAPQAHKQHVERVIKGYVRSLQRSSERGEMPSYEPHEIETVAYMLIAIRDYLSLRYGTAVIDEATAEEIAETYIKMIGTGLFNDPGR